MNKLLSLIFVIGISIVGVGATQASVCGIDGHRGPYNGCIPVYGAHSGYHGGYYFGYRRGYYRGYRVGHYGRHQVHYRHHRYPFVRLHDGGDVIAVGKGLCGFGSYLGCTQGTCWRFCY